MKTVLLSSFVQVVGLIRCRRSQGGSKAVYVQSRLVLENVVKRWMVMSIHG
jgi:hypothetical protein